MSKRNLASSNTSAAAATKKLGVCIASYGVRSRATTSSGTLAPFKDALDLLEHCHKIGAGGVQTGVGGWDADLTRKVRDKREALGLFLEGQIGLPKNNADVARFEKSLQTAKQAGADILRTACLGGRRYETFDSAEAFRRFADQSWTSLTLAEPALKRERVRLAVENHKDWRIDEMLGIMNRLQSEWIGVCLDTGNNIALLEDPMEVVEALAPFTLTVHLKDMGVLEYPDGFLLSEVPLGDGFLDLKRMIQICDKANPSAQFNLEMITRDPLKVPCLNASYWPTFGQVPARDLARTVALVKRHQSDRPLPHTTGKSAEEQIAFEEENVQKSIAYARKHLNL